MSAKHYQYKSTFTIQVNVTRVVDRVLTGKDKLRHPIPLTKQNAQELGLHVKSSCLKRQEKKLKRTCKEI